jgi:hypothetical protein
VRRESRGAGVNCGSDGRDERPSRCGLRLGHRGSGDKRRGGGGGVGWVRAAPWIPRHGKISGEGRARAEPW